VLYLPDEIIVVDHRKEEARRYRYEFRAGNDSTAGLARNGDAASYAAPYAPGAAPPAGSDHAPGEYAATVRDLGRYWLGVNQTIQAPSSVS
jgi:anthranilate synthase